MINLNINKKLCKVHFPARVHRHFKEDHMDKELFDKVQALKKERSAVILAHYYCTDDVQAAADYVGDSFYLAKVAKSADCKVIVFCGVEFMGESAKILSPEKEVLLPDLQADCPMAHMATAARVAEMREKYSDLAVVCYVNSSAALKAVSDVCVTSANALKIVQALPNENVYFIPDGNLGRFVREKSGKNVILNDGFCPIHNDIRPEQIAALKAQHPEAEVLAHPECPQAALDLSDYVGSTSGIIEHAAASGAPSFIVATECGVLYELKKRVPDKPFYFPEPMPVCADMKKVTLEKVYRCLSAMQNRVEIPEETAKKALVPLKRMLELG